MMAAVARAIHLLHYGPQALLIDWLAWPLVGAAAESMAAAAPAVLGEAKQSFMTWFAARGRLTEDWLARSQARQYVILGAGLDSFAWRQPGNLQVYEVDEPSSQRWKRERTTALGLPVRDDLTWIPLDLEAHALASALREAGVDSSREVFVSWLGVIPYLTRDAIRENLEQLPPCQLAVAYVPEEQHWGVTAKPLGRYFQAQVAELGEPWLSLLSPEELAALLARAGFDVIEDLAPTDIQGRYGLPAVHHERIALAHKPAAHLG
jgi:methyltransferase (TIGR00027 family)